MPNASSAIRTRGPRATEALGAAVARVVPDGALLALIGALGGGKTTFARGFLRALGARTVASPTFVLVHHHRVRRGRLRLVLHADLYRLAAGSDLGELGLDEGWGRAGTVTLVEWADRLRALPDGTLVIRFRSLGPSRRLVTVPAALTRRLARPAARPAPVARPSRRPRPALRG